MFFAPRLSHHERTVVSRLQLLGVDGERTIRSRQQFRQELRDQLVTEASGHLCSGDQQPALAGC